MVSARFGPPFLSAVPLTFGVALFWSSLFHQHVPVCCARFCLLLVPPKPQQAWKPFQKLSRLVQFPLFPIFPQSSLPAVTFPLPRLVAFPSSGHWIFFFPFLGSKGTGEGSVVSLVLLLHCFLFPQRSFQPRTSVLFFLRRPPFQASPRFSRLSHLFFSRALTRSG